MPVKVVTSQWIKGEDKYKDYTYELADDWRIISPESGGQYVEIIEGSGTPEERVIAALWDVDTIEAIDPPDDADED